MLRLFVLLAAGLLGACTMMKITTPNPQTGYYRAEKQAKILVSKPIDLDARKSLILVPYCSCQFTKSEVANIHYFDEVIDIEDLEKRIIAANLTDKVPTVRERIGIANAAKYYRPFLWLKYEGAGGTGAYGVPNAVHLQLIDPATQEELFVAEVQVDMIWTGVNDQYTWYPLFNALIDYIKANSKTYSATAVPAPALIPPAPPAASGHKR